MKWDELRNRIAGGLQQGQESARLLRQIALPLKISLAEQAHWLKSLPTFTNPQLLASSLEEKSPLLAKTLVRAAALLENPYREALGLRLLHRDTIELRALLIRPPKGLQGGDSGALLTLANFVAESFWQQFLDLEHAAFECREQTVRWIQTANEGPLRGQIRVCENEREALFSNLRVHGEVAIPVQIEITDSRDIIVAEVEWQWQMKKGFALEGQSGGSTDSTPSPNTDF